MDLWFQKIGYYSHRDPGHSVPQVEKFKKPNGDEFFNMSVTIGIDDEPRLIDGAPIIPWHVLNDYNRERSGNEDLHSADGIIGN